MKRSVALGLSLFAAVAATAGCSGADASGEAQSAATQPVVSDKVHVIDMSEDVDVSAEGLTFYGPSDAIRSLRPGDLVASAAKDDASGGRARPEGFLRAVLSVEDRGNALFVSTRQASLEEAIVETGADGDANLLNSVPLHPVLVHSGEIHPNNGTVTITPYDYSFSPASPLTLDGNVTISITGKVKVQPLLDLGLQIRHGKVSYFKAALGARIDQNADLKFAVSGSVSASQSYTLMSTPPAVLVQWIGPVPIVETVSASLVASASASIDANTTVSLTGESLWAQYTVGAEYNNGRWTNLAQHNDPLGSFTAPTLSVSPNLSANVSMGVSLRAQVLFYGVAGPYVEGGPYVRGTWTPPSKLTASAGVNASFGGEIRVLGHTVADYNAPLFDYAVTKSN